MDARLRKGIRLFNARRFFESHEVLEDFYLHTMETEDKPFLEAIIQLSVAFRLFSDFGDVEGPVRMVYQALVRLENYSPTYARVKVDTLIQALEKWAEQAKAGADKTHARNDIPKIGTALSLI
jgi:predicted metal-dependent hydrolase